MSLHQNKKEELKPSGYFQLACRILLLKWHKELAGEIHEIFDAGRVDVLKFIHLCSNHLVLPAIYDNLKHAGLTKFFPGDLVAHLEDIYRLNVERNLKILEQID